MHTVGVPQFEPVASLYFMRSKPKCQQISDDCSAYMSH